jgi:hypothetical protein
MAAFAILIAYFNVRTWRRRTPMLNAYGDEGVPAISPRAHPRTS